MDWPGLTLPSPFGPNKKYGFRVKVVWAWSEQARATQTMQVSTTRQVFFIRRGYYVGYGLSALSQPRNATYFFKRKKEVEFVAPSVTL
jgi:hypothetical protein